MGSASLNPTMGRVLVLAILILYAIVVTRADAGLELETIGEEIGESLVYVDINSLKLKREAEKQEKKKDKKVKKKKNGKKVKKKRKNKNPKRKIKKNGSNKSPKKKGDKYNKVRRRKKNQTKEKKKKNQAEDNKKKRNKNNKERNKTKKEKNGNKIKKKKNANKNKKKKNGNKKKKKKKGNEKKKKKKGDKKKKKKKGNKKKWGTKKKTKQSTCPSTREVDITCMKAALEGMLFEKSQITNYLKQARLLERHQSLSGNKAGKKDQFKDAEDHLLWAVGGNMSNPKCGPNDTSTSKYNSTLYEYELNLAKQSYAILINCSDAIHAACNISNLEGYDQDGHAENMTICRNLKKEAIGNNDRCQRLTEDVTAQCNCWINQTLLIDKIKEFKCNTKENQKLVTNHKKKCIDTFKVCKQVEDKSVESVYFCMEDHSMSFINQTSESLQNSASRDSRLEAERILNDEFKLKEFLMNLDKK